MSSASKGAALENRARRQLERDGYNVMRSAASSGPFDLHAWNAIEVRYIQVKSGGRAKRNVKDIRYQVKTELQDVVIPEGGTAELWVWFEREWRKYTLIGVGNEKTWQTNFEEVEQAA